MILSGRAIIQIGDVWSNNSVLGSVGPGETFAEAFACVPGEPVLANVTAEEDATALLLNVGRVIAVCSRGCGYHIRLVQNLLALYARKNLQLSRRILHTGSKTIRGRVLSYFLSVSSEWAAIRSTSPTAVSSLPTISASSARR